MTRFTLSLILVALVIATSFADDSQSEAEKWEKKYEQLLKDRPKIRKKVESGGATKEQVIAWMKKGGDRQKANGEKKYYGARIEVKDPAEFRKAQEKIIFSGPQPGEPLPAFKATVLRGEVKGEEIDPVARADGKPLVLIFQDNSVVGQKGLLLCGQVLATIADKSPQGLHVSTTFVVNDPTPSRIFKYDFMDEIDNVVEMNVSRDRRDGPGAYGLDRNIPMTIIVAKDSKVLHNFALRQPMLYPDPHVMGAIADAIGVDRPTLAGWFKEDKTSDVAQRTDKKKQADERQETGKANADSDERVEKKSKTVENGNISSDAKFGAKLHELVSAGKITCEEAGELYRVAFPESELRREER